MDVPSPSRPLHHLLTTQDLLQILFERLGREEKKNMAMVCKGWSKWFLIGNDPEVKERDYYRGVVHGNENGVITIVKNNRMLDRFCICTTMSNQEKKPKVGQVFETLESAELFYKEYCTICGFTPRLATTKRIKGNELPNSFALRNVVCNRQGVKESRKRKRMTSIPISPRMMRESIFDEAHNHPLASPESTIFLKGNRKMTEVQKQFVTKVKVLKLGGVKAYRGWNELCGGYNNIRATEVDFKNFVRDIKTYIGNFDAQMFVENLIGRKDTCNSFYFDFIVDENKCLAGVFWADPICIKNYMLFGEVLSADATYRTNKYDMVFVPFTRVDHHKRCITFGAGLLGDESIECYTWLFKTFLEAMGGCQPRIIIAIRQINEVGGPGSV
ncbi:protein FAR1-RELATED SEQUENCE 5-like [Silene latifolia]|uniref:protein FAR1-RELATED SEQUENCE 5-like n=1 Tax=Silene latifolia TaxID=37657 RepID=UPI003D776F09